MAPLRCLSVALFLLPLACGGARSPDAEGGGTVSGSVLDDQGNPMLGHFNVLLSGQVQMTGPDGSFSFSDVPPTYDITVAWGNGAMVYQGMTTRSPVFHFAQDTNAAKVSVQLPAPVDDTHHVAFFATSAQGKTTQVGVYGAGGPNTVTFVYFVDGAVAPPVTLHALTYETDPATKMLTKWTGHAELDSVYLNAPLPTWVVQPSPVETGTIGVAVDVPSGITLEKMTLALHFEPANARFPLTEVSTSTPSTQFTVPIVPGLSFDALAEGTTSDGHTTTWARNVTAGTTVALGLNEPPHIIGPDDGATEANTQTAFTFTPDDRGVQMVTFYPPQSDPNYFSIQMVTSRGAVTIPDFTLLGHPLPKGEVYTWNVARLPLGKSVDAASSAPILDDSVAFDAESSQRQFTTAH
ncbi:MAG TPA: hypothetical protein VGI39_00850 [Polyangiaceae bacterium]|jgi:hypothetical protein